MTYYVFTIILLGSDPEEIDIYADSEAEAWKKARAEAADLYDHFELRLSRKV